MKINRTGPSTALRVTILGMMLLTAVMSYGQATRKISSLPYLGLQDTGTHLIGYEASGGVITDYSFKPSDIHIPFTNITFTPTTLSGYGLSGSVYTKAQVDSDISSRASGVTGGVANVVPVYTGSTTMGQSDLLDSTGIKKLTIKDSIQLLIVPIGGLPNDSPLVVGPSLHILRKVAPPSGTYGENVVWPGNTYGPDTTKMATKLWCNNSFMPYGAASGVTNVTASFISSTLNGTVNVANPTTTPSITFSVGLQTVNATPGSIGSPSMSLTAIFDIYGRATSVSANPIALRISQLITTGSLLSTNVLHGDGSWSPAGGIYTGSGGVLLTGSNFTVDYTYAGTFINAIWHGVAITSPYIGNITGGQVKISGISATGTPGPTNFLRGDSTWATRPEPR